MAKQAKQMTENDNEEIVEGDEREEVVADEGAVEARARRMGWHPKDEYNGPAGKWVDATAFVARSETELPVLRDRLRSLDRRLETSERSNKETNTRLNETLGVLEELRTFSLNSETRAYNKAKREIETQMATAVTEADTAGFARAKAELDAMGAPPVAPVKKPTPAAETKPDQRAETSVPPEVQTWVDENPWFNNDKTLNSFATMIHGEILKEKPGISLTDNLAEVKEECRRRYPEKFGVVKKPTSATVAEGGSGREGRAQSGDKKKSYNDLPAEAKAQCDKFVKQIPKYTRDEYVAEYFAGEVE